MNDSKKLTHRLNRIEGQVRGLNKMLEDDAYCIDIITQTSAVKKALGAFEDALLEKHLSHCVIDQIQGDDQAKAIEEILKVYRLKRSS